VEEIINAEIELQGHKLTREEVLNDYRMACESRSASILGRKEVFSGKAKFGIFGDGKEIAQLALAKVFKKGDWRSGYYRDQTILMALGEVTLQQFFAQLYAHADLAHEPHTGGRLMNVHYATRSLYPDGSWKPITQQYNSAADVSCTGAQMPRLVGLAWASKLYRTNPALSHLTDFSYQGGEIAFGTIGNGSTAEGQFFEAINAAGVLQIPMIVSIWDDEYAISVPNEFQTTKGDIYKVLEGFKRDARDNGFELFQVDGYDYSGLVRTYKEAEKICREHHVPVLIHVHKLTQPLGHSSSGSHERYKSKDRLQWELDFDCIKKTREWIFYAGLATNDELNEIELNAELKVKEARDRAWSAFKDFLKDDLQKAAQLIGECAATSRHSAELNNLKSELEAKLNPIRSDALGQARRAMAVMFDEQSSEKEALKSFIQKVFQECDDRYSSHLYSQSEWAAIKVEEIKPFYSDSSPFMDGKDILRTCFDLMLERDPRVVAFGEDVGDIGDVNQAFAGLQDKYGVMRVTDTGIRECTIMGQGIGTALRGLRPIAEIQYLDYMLYALQILSDDLACLHYRTKGGQKAPLIVRTRGHRLEGVWHSGSPMSMMMGCLHGMYLCVPRNFVQASGMYNTLLKSDDPAIVVEPLNGYRLKERMPENIGEMCIPLGKPEVLLEGNDITIVTYGSMCRIVMEAAHRLAQMGISAEVVDIQTLMPFDIDNRIIDSIKKTNRVLFTDEDVPGGASAFMMEQVIDKQNAYRWLDSSPRCLSAKAHRPAYSSDGDYFSKPSADDVFEKSYEIVSEAMPERFPPLYS
jgi:pyruvate/2-oxoglutarate/acetoin dehydrogenase E1 component/TPP-dependent pyruvate/acetoin dehydrogenase alpha subunit